MINYWIGVDGGGTATRVRLQRANGECLGMAETGPSGLIHGIPSAWEAILAAIDGAFNSTFSSAALPRPSNAEIALGLGLAGVHNHQWAAEFIAFESAQNQRFGALALDTDAFTALLGAHQGQPGAIITLGTGSVGEALLENQTRRVVGGWGFPAGDEASGAWMGLRAIGCAQQAQDGRAYPTDFTQAVLNACGGNREALFVWLENANQTRYAQLAPIVLEYAGRDAAAQQIVHRAALEMAKLIYALDPSRSLPLALCGGLAGAMLRYLPTAIRVRLVAAKDDAVGGALILLRRHLENAP
jgi:glucosamine kinase